MVVHSAPDKLGQKLCMAITQGKLSRVKRLCRKRLQQSEDGTLGFFTVAAHSRWCLCFPVPNTTFYQGTFEMLPIWDETCYEAWEERYAPKPPKLCAMICVGKCMCTRGDRDIERKISPLVVACCYGHLEIVRYLLEVDISVINTNAFMTPLMCTMICRKKRNRFDIANLLLQSGADVNITDKLSSVHALELAVVMDDAEMISFLLSNGVDVNSLEISPLPLSNNTSIRRMLLNAGAKVLNSNMSRCPFYHAVKYRSNEAIQDYLSNSSYEKNHEYSNTRMTIMGSFGYVTICDDQKILNEVVNFLLQDGLHVDSYVPGEITRDGLRQFSKLYWNGVWSSGPATFQAIKRYCPKNLNYFLECGANVNFENNFGVTPLMTVARMDPDFLCAKSERQDCFAVLLEHGANLVAQDIFGRTAVHYTVSNEEQDPFVFERLMELNVEFYDQSTETTYYRRERSPFYLACLYGNFVKARLLIDYGYNVRKETWLMKSELVPRKLGKHTNMLQEFSSAFQKPADLKSLCRNAIRGLVGIEIVTILNQLSRLIPCTLMDYLLFK